MQAITTIGLDIAKSVFQVHGVDAAGQVVIRLDKQGSPIRRAESKFLYAKMVFGFSVQYRLSFDADRAD